MRTRDQWTIDRWRTEPPLQTLDIEVEDADQNPPLWKDLACASVIALILWAMVAATVLP